MKWFVVRTALHSEFKALNYNTDVLAIDSYVPSYRTMIQNKRSKYVKKLPLINSYLFFRQEKIDFSMINKNPYTKSVLVRNQKALEIPDDEIEAMKEHIENRFFQKDFNEKREGSVIEIRKGFFKGMYARITEKRNNKIYLSLSALEMQVVLTLNK